MLNVIFLLMAKVTGRETVITTNGSTQSLKCNSRDLPVWNHIRGPKILNIAIGDKKMSRFQNER